MYLASDLIFSKVPAVDSIDMEFPNLHYFVADLSIPNSGEVNMAACVLAKGGTERLVFF